MCHLSRRFDYFSSSFQEHIERLDLAMACLTQAGLKLSPEKCSFMQEKAKFLGHVVGPEGVEPNPDTCKKIQEFPTPSNSDQLRSFLALAGYYCKFIENFSKIAKLLNDLLPPTSTKKGNKQSNPKWKWQEIHQKTFDQIKQLFLSPPVLGYPVFWSAFYSS